jgi:hypothetical protein
MKLTPCVIENETFLSLTLTVNKGLLVGVAGMQKGLFLRKISRFVAMERTLWPFSFFEIKQYLLLYNLRNKKPSS